MATHIYPKGKCVEGDSCKFPHLWLRPQDKCPTCQQIVHPLCGVLTEDKEKYQCSKCSKSTSIPPPSPPPPSQSNATTITNNSNSDDMVETEITVREPATCSTIVSTITEGGHDTSHFTKIERDYFIRSDQSHNQDTKRRDGDIWKTLRKAVSKEIDGDLKAMMILRSQEIGLKVQTEDGLRSVETWNDIGEAWKNDDSVHTAKKLFEIVHGTFDDNSGYEIYMENQIMNRLELKYDEDEGFRKKGCIARMIITRKSELNKLINKRSESTHQKKISSKRTSKDKKDRNSKGTFTIKGPDKSECYNRDGSICGSKGTGDVNRFDSHYYMEKIRLLEQQKNMVWHNIF